MPTIITPPLRARLIAAAKARASKEDIVALVGNLPTMRLVLAWPTVTIHVPEGEVRNANNVMRDCRKIWLGVEVDYDELAAVTRVPHACLRNHVFEAQMHLWIYPDHSVHPFARDLAKATIVKVAQRGGNT